MSVVKWIVGLMLLVFSVALARAGEYAPRIEVINNGQAKVYNVRFQRQIEGHWALRGRLTRSDRDVKVPKGQVKALLFDERGKQIHSAETRYKPQHVHPKKKRASYFTVHLPQDLHPSGVSVKVYYLSD
ncbi:hypothetical protein [Motiliproteus coralliicola]|nr:hypothetical protein [Motiliproteus coralliicola]